jgi:hypothetical protein
VSGHPTKRVPIILTGNNPSILYQPLLRAGRMRLMDWVPNVEDKTPIVARIFPGIPETEIKYLISLYPKQPVSFWSDINARFWEIKLSEWLAKRSRDSLIGDLIKRNEYAMEEKHATIAEIKKLAVAMSVKDMRNTSYLDKQ